MKKLTHVRNAVYGEPWAIREGMLDTIAEIVECAVQDQARDMSAVPPKKPSAMQTINGVDVIPVCGPISKRMNLFQAISGGTSLDCLASDFAASQESDSVCTMLVFDSPGGTVSGIAEFASAIYQARLQSAKPIVALADGQCCSAAVWLATQCDAFYTTEASIVGNIGVIAKLDNTDRAERNAGNDPIVIKSSELKGIGMTGQLTPSQHSALAARVGEFYGMFKDAVIRGRGNKIEDIEAVAGAQDFIGASAVKCGLCDGVATLDELLARYGEN